MYHSMREYNYFHSHGNRPKLYLRPAVRIIHDDRICVEGMPTDTMTFGSWTGPHYSLSKLKGRGPLVRVFDVIN